jgi:hypothetical protein
MLAELRRSKIANSFLFSLQIIPTTTTIVFASKHDGCRDAAPPPKTARTLNEQKHCDTF